MRAVALLLLFACSTASAQTFVKITDPSNPVATDVGPQFGFPGAAWIDIDGNGLPDLWSTSTGLYRNLGGGVFDKPPGAQGAVVPGGLGCTWGDYDNDGDADLFIASGMSGAMGGSALYRNDSPPGTGTSR